MREAHLLCAGMLLFPSSATPARSDDEEAIGLETTRALFGSGDLPGLTLLNGDRPLDQQTTLAVVDRIVRPRLRGWRVLSIKNVLSHERHFCLEVQTESAVGEKAMLPITYHRYEGKVAVYLPRMMEIAWEFDGARKTRYDEKTRYTALASGLQKDQALLREIGLRKFWYHKEEVTISSLLAEYRTWAHKAPVSSSPP
ncbi:MAG: hypothetical protein KIS66_09995 [Fimbriimonadaceae bacterium]|nr:hypothetical protein [Fimbriimonadaceae bacterium]